MASTRTLVVAVAVVAVFAQLSAATCPCGCASGSATYEYAAAAPAAASGAAVVEVQDDSWAREFPSNAIITNTQVNDNCAYNEIRMPDEAAPAIGIVRQPCAPAAQHLSYNIEVPVNQERPIVPSYHGVSVEVPVRARTVTQSFGPLGYSVEVPVQQEQSCQKLPNLPVEIAVPVRQRQLDIRQHSTYSVEVPAASALSSRLTNLKANVDRIVMPSYQGCVSGPNNAPVANQEVTYVAVPAAGPICTSPVGLLGLRKTFAPAAPAASSGPAPSSGRYVPLGLVGLGLHRGAEDASSEEDDSAEGAEDGGKAEEEQEEASVVRAGCFYSEPEEEGRRGRRARRDVSAAETEEQGGKGGEGAEGGVEGADEDGGSRSESKAEEVEEVVEQVREHEEREEKEEHVAEEEISGGGEGGGESDEVGGDEDSEKAADTEADELNPAVATAADGSTSEDGEAAALNKRMCNSQRMSRRGGGGCGCGSRVTTAVRLADDCGAGGRRGSAPTRFYLDTYDEADQERAAQSSPCDACSCDSGRDSGSRSAGGRSTCSVWRPSTSSSSSMSRSSSSCSGSRRGGRRRVGARGQSQGECQCGASSRQSCTCRSRRPSRRQGSRTCGTSRARTSSSCGRSSDGDSHMIIAPYRIPETAVRDLLNECPRDCGCGCRGGRGGRIVNQRPSDGCGGRRAGGRSMDDSDGEDRILTGEDEDYEDDGDYEDYDDEDMDDDVEDRAMPSCDCGAPTRRCGVHDMVRATQRAHAENTACVGRSVVLVNGRDGMSPLNRDALADDCGSGRAMPACECGAARELPPSTCQCGAARELPTSTCQCGAARELPTSTCQCGAARELPTSTCQCGAARELPPSTCQCGAARELPTSTCQCGAARELPTSTCQCGAARELPTSTCQCGAARDLATADCGSARALPVSTCTCAASRELPQPSCPAARDLSPSFMCPVCGKGLRPEHVDHIFRCLQEARERAAAVAEPCGREEPRRAEPCGREEARAATTVVEMQPHTIMIPVPVTVPCSSARAAPVCDPAPPVQVAVERSAAPAAPCAGDLRSSASASWVREWIDQINRAIQNQQPSAGGCGGCGCEPCSYCRGGRSVKAGDALKEDEIDILEEGSDGTKPGACASSTAPPTVTEGEGKSE